MSRFLACDEIISELHSITGGSAQFRLLADVVAIVTTAMESGVN